MPLDVKPLPDSLESPLSRLRTRCVQLACVRGVGVAIAVFITGAILTGWTDLIITLPSTVRLAAVIVLFTAGAGLLISEIIRTFRRWTPRILASSLDNCGQTGGQIRAGVELAQDSSYAAHPLSSDLSRRAVDRAASLAGQQDPLQAQPARPALRPFLAALLAILFIGAAWLIWPEMVVAQAARVFDPTGNHAKPGPYSFTIKPSATAVLYGEPFEVTVIVKGAQPAENFEWVVEQPGLKPWRLPLLSGSDGALVGNLSSVISDFNFSVVGPRGQSALQHIKVINVPQIKETGVRLVFPDYTGLPAYEGPLPPAGAAGVRGTKVTLMIASNRPLAGGRIEIKPDPVAAPKLVENPVSTDVEKSQAKPAEKPLTEIPVAVLTAEMAPLSAKGNVVSGTFEITGDLGFSAVIRDTDGTPSAPFAGRCLLVPDQPPRISISEPLPSSFATTDITLPVVIDAEDDFGISEVILYRSLNGSRDVPLKLPLSGGNRKLVQLTSELPLKEWSLDPGDVLEIYALARDNDPAGAKTTQTGVHRITIITKEQYQELQRQQETIDDVQERYQPWLKRLNELRQKWNEAKKSNDPKKMEEMKEALREDVERLENQLKEPPVFAADEQFSKELRDLQDSLKKAGEDIDKGNYDDVDKALGDEAEKLKKELEIPLEHLAKYYRLLEDEATYTALAQAQEDMARRLKRFADKKEVKDPQDVRDLKALQDEQRELREALERTLQDIRDHAAKLPKEDEKFKELVESANDFATKAHDLGIDESLKKCDAAMSANKGEEAAKEAGEAAEKMMSLVQKGEAMEGEAMEGLRPFGPSMGETAGQMLNGRGLPKPGSKSGGGFSRRGGSRGQVGVYGNSNKPKSRGGGRSDKKSDGSINSHSGEHLVDPKGFGIRDQFDDGSSAGGAMQAMPGKYRSAVRDFYRKVTDELERGK